MAHADQIDKLKRDDQNLIQHNFCFPATVISDRGTAFTSSEFVSFLKNNNVKQHLVAVAAPWANGLVERINRFLKSSLRKLVDDYECWNIYLKTVQYVINNSYHSSLKASPSKVLLGVEQRNNTDVKIVDCLHKIAYNEFDIQADRQSCRELASEATKSLKNYNKMYYDKKHAKPTVYKVGDYVLIKDTAVKSSEGRKLKSEYKGPYQIAKVLDMNRYVVTNIPGFNVTAKAYNSILSTDRIKPWIKPFKLSNTMYILLYIYILSIFL